MKNLKEFGKSLCRGGVSTFAIGTILFLGSRSLEVQNFGISIGFAGLIVTGVGISALIGGKEE